MQDILSLSVCELAEEMHKGRLSAKQAAGAYLAQIHKKESEIGAYLL